MEPGNWKCNEPSVSIVNAKILFFKKKEGKKERKGMENPNNS